MSFRKVAIYAVIFDPLGQARPLVVQLLLVEINAGLLRDLRAGWLVLAGRRLGDCERERTPARDIHHCQGRNLQAPFRTLGAAVEEVPEPKGLFAALGNKRSILRRDQF